MQFLYRVCLLAVIVILPVSAQQQVTEEGTETAGMVAPAPAQIEAIEQVSHWVGEWSGTGWSMNPARERENFEIVENVSLRLGGSVLLVEGRGVTEQRDGVRKTTHESLAILSFDPEASRYNWRTYDLRGSVRDPDFAVDPDAFRWGFRDEESGVLLRFTIVVKGDTWHEIGEVSPDDGENWYTILEMNLARQ